MADITLAKRQRGAPIVARVLETALAEISRSGFENLSIERVATRSGVNRTTIYRRWPTPHLLATAALTSISDREPFPDTGSLRGDLTEFLTRFRSVCRAPAMLSLIRLSFNDGINDELKTLITKQLEQRDDGALAMFERAVGRNELRDDVDLPMLRDLLIGGAQYLIVFRQDEGLSNKLESLVDLILRSAVRPDSGDV